jgi:hypothetical protein
VGEDPSELEFGLKVHELGQLWWKIKGKSDGLLLDVGPKLIDGL